MKELMSEKGDMIYQTKQNLISRARLWWGLIIVLLLTACGAPTRSASEVASIFEESAPTLQQKVNLLCETISRRTQPPTLEGMELNLNGCRDAGLSALDYSTIDSFYFIGLDEASQKTPANEDLRMDLRSQVWLNRGMLNFALSVMKQMNKGSTDSTEELWDGKNGMKGSMKGLVKPRITEIEPPRLNTEDFSFNTKINFFIEGLVNANNDLMIAGALIDKRFLGLTIKSISAPKSEDSFVKSVNALMIIVPHAGDVYVDLFASISVYNAGFETLIKNELPNALGSGLKATLDKLMALE
jgi:hypothetical protein